MTSDLVTDGKVTGDVSWRRLVIGPTVPHAIAMGAPA